jgi:FkbM family methyltransferase
MSLDRLRTGTATTGFRIFGLTWRARATYAAHAFKAVTKRHHRELRPLLRRHIATDAVIFDVGAHAGQFTKLFATMAPRGHVYSFEPGSYARSILEMAVPMNRLRNVTVVPMGLGDAVETQELTVPLKPRGSHRFGLSHLGAPPDASAVRCEPVAITTIDRFAAAEKLARLDFLKADIEGWEQRMIEGGRETISRFRPTMMIELAENHLNRAGDSLGSAWEALGSLGYHPYLWDGSGGLAPLDRPRPGDIFWLAHDG